MDEPSAVPETSELNQTDIGQQQEEGKQCWPAFMTVQNFLSDSS
jgi:hypothetical protein